MFNKKQIQDMKKVCKIIMFVIIASAGLVS